MKLTKLFTTLFATGLSLSVFTTDIAELTRKAEQGDATAQYNLGITAFSFAKYDRKTTACIYQMPYLKSHHSHF